MTIVNWNENVNKRILKNGTSWNEPVRFIEDETRSGKRKRRLLASCEKRQFSVAMRLNMTEYEYFIDWFKNTTKSGVYAFYFPLIDSENKNIVGIYRFKNDGLPSYSNSTGRLVDVSMVWEEVDDKQN